MYIRYFKRLFDLIFASIALVVLSPVIAIVALLVKIRLGSPVIFKQNRPGKDEKIFTMYKFRTMTEERNANGELLPDSLRLTKFGRFLRSSSLDEIPELWSIVKGDMSIVGPRPQLIKDLVFMDDEQRKRQRVMPGLTGLAQINGRNSISWEDKLSIDLEYIEHITLLNDLKIILITIKNVLLRKGINAEGMATAEDLGDYLLRQYKINDATYHEKMKLTN